MASTVAAAPVTVGRPRAVYTRLTVFGLLLIAGMVVLIGAAGIVAGNPVGEAAMFAVPLVIASGAAFATWRLRLAGKITAIVIALAAAVLMHFAAFGLAYPGAFADFVGAVMFVLGVGFAFGGGIAGIVQQRRGNVQLHAGRREAKIMRAAIVVLALAVVGSGIASLASRTTVDSAAAAGATAVTMQNMAFTPGTYEIAAGEPAKILVHNSDAYMHDFTIPALDIKQALTPGSSTLVEITAPAGSYTVYCTLHSDTSETDPQEAGMAAALIAK